MTYLIIDTSLGVTSLAIGKSGTTLCSFHDDVPNAQAGRLAPQIDDLMKGAALGFKALQAVYVVTGPGGFTSVRIGVACARGIAFAANIPCFGASLLSVMAHHAFTKHSLKEDSLQCAVAAGRRDVAVQRFSYEHNMVQENSDMALRAKDSFAANEVLYCTERITDGTIFYLKEHTALTLCDMAGSYPQTFFGDAAPLYARPPDAAIGTPLLQNTHMS